ncbi:MAG: MFS transporter [Bacteroidales bacterium]
MDNEKINMDTMPLGWRHVRVFLVASLGQFLGAAQATLVGIIIPLFQIIRHPELSSFQQGVIACTGLMGRMLGSLFFGHLSDRFGYLLFFRLCPVLLFVASGLAFWFDNLVAFTICLFFMGFSIGGEYALDPDYISEIMPDKWKLLMVGASKATSAIGNILMAMLCFFFLKDWQSAEVWNRLLLIMTAGALIMILARIRFAQSPGWLIAHGNIPAAEKVVQYFLGKNVVLGNLRNKPKKEDLPKVGWSDLFQKGMVKKIVLGGVPWACEGVGVYGVGMFTPVLVLSLGLEAASEGAFERIVNSLEITSYINLFYLVGFGIGLFLVNRVYHIRIQTWGFLLCAAGLTLLLVAYKLHWATWIALAGFMSFEVFLNAGPHLMTFILPSQIYSVAERGSGVGLSAAIGKLGAVIGVLFIPLLLKWGGATLVLAVTIGVNILGAFITFVVGRAVFPPDKYKKGIIGSNS